MSPETAVCRDLVAPASDAAVQKCRYPPTDALDARPAESRLAVADVTDLTRRLRADGDAAWVQLRTLLLAQGVSLKSVFLADFCEVADDAWMGILVGHDQVVEFSYELGADTFSDWILLTEWWRDTPYRDSIALAQSLLSGETHA